LELFMGWDRDKIEANRTKKLKERIEDAKIEYLLDQISKNGRIDIKDENDENAKTFKEILQENLTLNEQQPEEKENSNNDDIEDNEQYLNDFNNDQDIEDNNQGIEEVNKLENEEL